MARSQIRHNVKDAAGNAIQGALVHVFEQGTSTPVADMFAALSGGAAITTLTSNNQGEVVGYLDGSRYVDLSVTDNGGTAFYPSLPSSLLTWTAFTETVAASADATTVAMPSASGVASTDADALARAIVTATALVAAGGRPTIQFQAGIYRLNEGVPLVEGVSYEGVPPVLSSVFQGVGYMPDADFEFVGGTVLLGDGSSDCFYVNTTDVASVVEPTFAQSQVAGVRVYGFGVDGYVNGFHAGAENVMGLVWGEVDELYFRNCSEWGMQLVNYQHVSVGRITDCLCANGQWYGTRVATTTLNPGNSVFRDLFHKHQDSTHLGRGIVFEADEPAGGVAALGLTNVISAQANCFNRTTITQTATFTNTSSTVAVTDGTKYRVGMPVYFTTSAAGFLAEQIYVVKSVAGNNLTIASSRHEAAIVASASTTASMVTNGFAGVEIVGVNTGSLVAGFRFLDIDVEGDPTVGVYAENLYTGNIYCSYADGTVGIVGRNCVAIQFSGTSAGPTDFDPGSTDKSSFHGHRLGHLQYGLSGLSTDEERGNAPVLSIGPGESGGQGGGDIERRALNLLYPTILSVAQHVRAQNSTTSLAGICGSVVSTSASNTIYTLPTIVTKATNPHLSNVGTWYEIVNLGTGTVTVNTAGSQLLNGLAGVTSLTVLPYQSVKLVAAENSTLFWVAYPVVGLKYTAAPQLASRRATRTSGSIVANSTAWANLDTGLDLTVPALAGDFIEVSVNGVWLSEAVAVYLDAVTLVAGAPVTSLAQGIAPTATGSGVWGWRGDSGAQKTIGGGIGYALQAGDVSGGNVTVRLRYFTATATNKTLYCPDTNSPFSVAVVNHGQKAV